MDKTKIESIIHDNFLNACTIIMKDRQTGDTTPSQESEIDNHIEKLADIMLEVYKQNQEHVAKPCQFKDCNEDATRWIEDPNYPDDTFYFCMEHTETHNDEDECKNSAGEVVEVAAYSCSDNCLTCN